MSITLEDLQAVRAALTQWKGAETGASFMGARIADLVEAWEQFVDTDWERWDRSEYDHDLDTRYWLQVVLEHCATSTRDRLEQVLRPIDIEFQNRMSPAKSPKILRVPVLSGHPYFWETHTLRPKLAVPRLRGEK